MSQNTKCAPLYRNAAQNVYRRAEMQHQKRKMLPFVRKYIENTYPREDKGAMNLSEIIQGHTSFRRALEPLDLY